MRNIGYRIDSALADIIDNSITASAKNITVRFLWNDGDPWVAVIDDGCGMNSESLKAAMRFGSTSPSTQRTRCDLGRFGLGMKTASISQCQVVTVCSKSAGNLSACEWDLNRISSNDPSGWLLGIINEAAIKEDLQLSSIVEELLVNKNSGTIVLWRGLDKALAGTEKIDSERKFSEIMDNARSHLELVFHRFLAPDPGHKMIRIDFNQSPLIAFNPFGPAIPARQELPVESICINSELINIQPFVLPHRNKVSREDYDRYAGEGGYLQNQGFYVYRNRRLIVKSTWFRLIKKDELNKLIRVKIDIPNTLDHIWGINVNKSQVTPPEVVRKQLKSIINRISGRGKNVFKRKAAQLRPKGKIVVWNREIKNGKIKYSINSNHPLLSDILNKIPPEFRVKIENSYRMIAESFPHDIHYNDAANDEVDFYQENDPKATIHLCTEMIAAMKSCGIIGDELRKKLIETEIPGATEQLIDKLIRPEDRLC
ncbi:ATP-binding protein [Desulfoluna butyratoxydans]|uniref:ATP-binding protein n=1 Tax=Desulfoluna butyratoxydans TaxID=231438 RepID=UPI0015D16CF1|nr:ATP-binding protein [Desulfoluna butyratoxydans]